MIKQYRVCLHAEERLPVGTAYQCYGSLVEQLPADLVASWHYMKKTPIRQCLFWDKAAKAYEWRISLLDEEAVTTVSPVLDQMKSVALRGRNPIDVASCTVHMYASAQAFASEYLVAYAPTRAQVFTSLSPIAFKSDNQYQNMPSVRLIYQSLLQSWASYSDAIELSDPETFDALCQYTHIQKYQLRSTIYPLKGVRIPAFYGSFTLLNRGPEPLVRLSNLLWAFAPYAGIGIKTTLGMGGVQVERTTKPEKGE